MTSCAAHTCAAPSEVHRSDAEITAQQLQHVWWQQLTCAGRCCTAGYQASGTSNGSSGGSAISAAGWRFNICQDRGRCRVEPSDGVSQWYRRLWQVGMCVGGGWVAGACMLGAIATVCAGQALSEQQPATPFALPPHRMVSFVLLQRNAGTSCVLQR